MRRLRALALAAVLGLGLVLAAPVSPASAHAGVESSTPENGASLTEAPTVVSITFDEPVTEPALTASDDKGTEVALGEVSMSGSTVSAAWPPGTPGGIYTVEWSIVSDDGDPLTGTILFSYTVATPSASGSPSASPTPTGSTSSAPATTASVSPSASASGSAQAAAEGSSSSPLPWILGLLALAAVVVVVVLLSRRTPDQSRTS